MRFWEKTKKVLSWLFGWIAHPVRAKTMGVSVLVVKVPGAPVEELNKYYAILRKELGIKESRLLVINDKTSVSVALFPSSIFVAPQDEEETTPLHTGSE